MKTQIQTNARPALTDRKKIRALYVVFFCSAFLTFLTPPTYAALSMMACVLILATIYSIRAQCSKDSLIYNHMTFLIRTFWRMNLVLLYGAFIGTVYMLIMTDYSPFYRCITYMMDRWMSVLQYWGIDQYSALFSQCTSPFLKENITNIVIGIFIMVFPALIYLLNRLILGWGYATRGIPVDAKKL